MILNGDPSGIPTAAPDEGLAIGRASPLGFGLELVEAGILGLLAKDPGHRCPHLAPNLHPGRGDSSWALVSLLATLGQKHLFAMRQGI